MFFILYSEEVVHSVEICFFPDVELYDPVRVACLIVEEEEI